MEIPVGEAQRQLAALIERARAGEEVVLLQNGAPAARLVGLAHRPAPARLRDVEALYQAFERHPIPDQATYPDAARSQDWLYDDKGLPV